MAVLNRAASHPCGRSALQSHLDGQLFHIRHLLLLRNQLSRFDAAFVQNERVVDLGRLQGAPQGAIERAVHVWIANAVAPDRAALRYAFLAAATALMRNSGRLLSLSKDNSLLRFLQEGLPSSIVVAQRDSRKVSATWTRMLWVAC